MELLSGTAHVKESDKAIAACNDWLRLGPGRTLTKLLDQYQDKSGYIRQYEPPTTSYKTLETWSSKFNWSERSSAFDAEWDAIKTRERNAEFGSGPALDFERVRRLKRLADFLEGQIFETIEEEYLNDDGTDTIKERRFLNVWVRDTKSIREGDNFVRVEIERFNPSLISEYRAVLDDLAKEVGDRVKRTDVTSGGDSIILKTGMSVDEL